MANPNQNPIEQPASLKIGPQFEDSNKNKKRIFILLGISFAIIALFLFIYFSSPICQMNPIINDTYLSIINKTKIEVNSFCKTSSEENSCLAKFYYTYTDSANIPPAQRVWLFKETQETIPGMVYKAKTEHICSWK